MTPPEIIQQFLIYAAYDPQKKTHNLLSLEYEFHKVCENIKHLLEFDPAGITSVLYAKHRFCELMKAGKVCAFDCISNPDYLAEEKEMYRIFTSPDVLEYECNFLNSLEKLIQRVISVHQIGERNVEKEREVLFETITICAENLQKLNVELFAQGGDIQTIRNFSTRIQVFERFGDCLAAMEGAQDGLYLVYINNNGTADGYFAYVIKSNGTILSLNERVREAFPGQHKASRNGRWSEDKKYELFPYNFIFSFLKHDYLGYAKEHKIEEGKLEFFNLQPEAYMPILISMLLINAKYAGKNVNDLPLMYVDSLLPNSRRLPTPNQAALIVPTSGNIMLRHDDFEIPFTSEDILRGTPQESFEWQNGKPHYETGTFRRKGQKSDFYDAYDDTDLFIELYGDGFELDKSKILEANRHIKYLTSTEIEEKKLTPNAEFISTKNGMELIAYRESRIQLAEYIYDRMAEEFIAFGGINAVKKWWGESLLANREKIYRMCLDTPAESSYRIDGGIKVSHQIQKTKNRPEFGWGEGYYSAKPFNETRDGGWHYQCAENPEYKATDFFVFELDSWKSIEALVGVDNLPKIIKGWRRNGHTEYGNGILSVCDRCTEIGTPFEYRQSQFNPRYQNFKDERGFKENTEMHFGFWVGFSKRELNKMRKQFK